MSAESLVPSFFISIEAVSSFEDYSVHPMSEINSSGLVSKARASGFARESGNSLLLGPFRYTADAALVLREISPDPTLRITQTRSERSSSLPSLASACATDLLTPLFFSTGEKASRLEPRSAILSNPVYQLLESYDTIESRSDYLRLLSSTRREVEDDDLLAGYVDVNLGIIALLNGRLTESQRILQPVASGEVNATDNHRLMAMWRLGWIAHQNGDHLEAYRIYTETQRFADNNPRTVIRCIKERTGLIMELAKDKGLGELAEVRRFVDDNEEVISNSSIWSDVATIRLMYAETLYYEGRYAEFIKVGTETLKAMPERAKKQRGTLLVFLGIAHHLVGNSAEGDQALILAESIEYGPNDHWQTIPCLKTHAANWRAYFNGKR